MTMNSVSLFLALSGVEMPVVIIIAVLAIALGCVGGIFVGFICGFAGAGGGMMLLLVLTTFLGYPMHLAVGTSVFIMAFTALTGGISHFVMGGIPDLLCLVLCVVFTLLWARIASKIANKSNAKTLNRVVGIVMIVTSIVILTVNYLQ